MKCTHFIVGVLVAALACGAAAGPVYLCGVPGDVNGDAQTDVRDIQVLAAALSKPDTNPVKGDANGDGRVDVLDFQYVVAQAGEEPAGPPPPRTPERPAAYMPATGLVLTVKLEESGGTISACAAQGPIGLPMHGDTLFGCNWSMAQRTGFCVRPPHAPPLRI